MKPQRRDSIIALAAGLAALAVYSLTLAPTVLPGDSGEFQFAAPLLGLAHPTGYPLYLILGKVWTLLVPLGDAAYRMNLLSAVLSAATVGAFYALARRLGMGTVPALLAGLTLAFSHTFWSQAVRAEVYALNSLFVVLLLYLAIEPPGGSATSGRVGAEQFGTRAFRRPYPTSPPAEASTPREGVPGAGIGLALFCVLGLSLAHHRTIILIIPALVVLLAGRPRPAARIPHLASRIPYLAALLLPLLLYLYIPLRAEATPYLRLAVGGGPELVVYENTLNDFLVMITGSVFRGSLGASAGMDIGGRLAMALDLLRQQVGAAGIVLAILGLLIMLRRTPRPALALAIAYGAVTGFCLFYSIGDIADFFTPAYIVVALCIGAGIQFVAETAARAVAAHASVIVLALAALLPLSLAAGNWQALDLSRQTATRSVWEEILREPLPQGAALVSNDRDEMTPMWYLQYVEKQRSDLVGLFPRITPAPQFATIGGLLDWLLERGQQPYLIKPMPGLEIKYRLQAVGLLTQVSGHVALSPVMPQTRLGAGFGGALELVGADVQATGAPGSDMTVTLYWTPLTQMPEDYHVFVQVVNAAGERVQGSDHRPGDVFYPTSAWQAGDLLADRHVMSLPPTLPAGSYTLLAGVYRYPAMTRLAVAGSQETTVRVATLRVQP